MKTLTLAAALFLAGAVQGWAGGCLGPGCPSLHDSYPAFTEDPMCATPNVVVPCTLLLPSGSGSLSTQGLGTKPPPDVWFLVIWTGVIPNPYPSENSCKIASREQFEPRPKVAADGTSIIISGAGIDVHPVTFCIAAPATPEQIKQFGF